MTPHTLRAAASWNYEKAFDALYWAEKTKNYGNRSRLLHEAGHHFTIGDNCRRTAFMIERGRLQKTRRK